MITGWKAAAISLSPALNEPVRNDSDAAYIANLEKEIALFEAEYSKTEDDDLKRKIDVLTGRLAYAQENLWDISKEGIEKYRQVAQNMHFPYKSLLLSGRNQSGYDAMYEKTGLYTSGQIDEEQFIAQLNEIARRAYFEAQ